jgi:transposase
MFAGLRVLKSLAEDNKKGQQQTKKQEPYKDISAYFKIPGMQWDIHRWIVDLAHEIGNLVKNMLQLTTNKKKNFSSLEKSLTRF